MLIFCILVLVIAVYALLKPRPLDIEGMLPGQLVQVMRVSLLSPREVQTFYKLQQVREDTVISKLEAAFPNYPLFKWRGNSQIAVTRASGSESIDVDCDGEPPGECTVVHKRPLRIIEIPGAFLDPVETRNFEP